MFYILSFKSVISILLEILELKTTWLPPTLSSDQKAREDKEENNALILNGIRLH